MGCQPPECLTQRQHALVALKKNQWLNKDQSVEAPVGVNENDVPVKLPQLQLQSIYAAA